jgi:hypothetical protein
MIVGVTISLLLCVLICLRVNGTNKDVTVVGSKKKMVKKVDAIDG